MSNISNELELTPFIRGKIKLYQSKDGYRFNLDPVLLSSFVKINKKKAKIVDLGTGSGIILLLLGLKYPELDFYAVEIQNSLFEIAKKNFRLNNLNVKIFNEDMKNIRRLFKPNSFDYVVSNPPYFKVDKSLSSNEEEKIAKFEVKINLKEIFKVVKYILKDRGKFFLVYPSFRFTECLKVATENKLELKKVRFVYADVNSNSTHFLAEFVKSAKEGLIIDKPLIIYENRKNKIYTEEVKYILEKFTDGEIDGN